MALTLSLLLAIGGNLYLTAPPAAVAAPSCTVNPMGASTPIGSDNGYTFFTSGDAVLGNTEMEGTLAVGGTAKFGDSSANTNLQYPIFQGGVGGNANYGIPKIDGDWNRVLLNRYAPGTQAKVVQLKEDGLTATPGSVGRWSTGSLTPRSPSPRPMSARSTRTPMPIRPPASQR